MKISPTNSKVPPLQTPLLDRSSRFKTFYQSAHAKKKI